MRPIVVTDMKYYLDTFLESERSSHLVFSCCELADALEPAIRQFERFKEPGQDLVAETFAAAKQYFSSLGILESQGIFTIPECMYWQYDLFDSFREILSANPDLILSGTWLSGPGQVQGYNYLAEFYIKFKTNERYQFLPIGKTQKLTMEGLMQSIHSEGIIGVTKGFYDETLARYNRVVFSRGKLALDSVYITTNPLRVRPEGVDLSGI